LSGPFIININLFQGTWKWQWWAKSQEN